MSVDLNVYLHRRSMPTLERWAQAIVHHGFPVELDTGFDVDVSSGFRPCKFRGTLAGFEYYCSRLSSQDAKALELPEAFDFAVTFTTGANLRECATSLIAASVLCCITGGFLFDPQEGEGQTADTALNWAKQQLAALEQDLVN